MRERPARPAGAKSQEDYRHLPPQVQLDETIASVDPDPAPDPDGGQNVDQRRALQDA